MFRNKPDCCGSLVMTLPELSLRAQRSNLSFEIPSYKFMNKTSYLKAKIAPTLKLSAERILAELGITPSQAITMLYKQVVRERDLPAGLKIPNAKTMRTLEEAERGIELVECKNIDDLFHKLGL
jgi:DNA-damage-inducible protein J